METAQHFRRDLPPLLCVVIATASVALLPPAVGWGLRTAGVLAAVPSILVAAGLSLVVSFLGQLYWQRRRASSEALFAELMLWGWVRRRRIERRVGQAISVLELTHGETAPDELTLDETTHGQIDLTKERRASLFRQLAADLEESDPYTHGHSQRVARYAALIGRELGLTGTELATLRTAALLHDVGKLYTPKEILHKPGRLTDHEFEVIKRHPVDGARMIRLLLADDELTSIVLHHHERIDGGGYPSGLTGTLIPLSSRIIAVADTFDAITSRRPYRPAMPHKVALGVLRREAGTQLDAYAVRAFLAAYSGRQPRAAAAGIAGAVEAVIPSLAGAGVRLAGVAAGAAVLATGGMAFPWGTHPRPGRAVASAAAPRPVVVAQRSAPRLHLTANRLAARAVSAHAPRAHAGSARPAGVHRATVPNSAATAVRSPSPVRGSTGASPTGSRPANPSPPTRVTPGGAGGGNRGGGGSGGPVGGGPVGGGPAGGGPAGGGPAGAGPVTVTTSGSGVGATVSAGGTSVGVNATTNSGSPGTVVSVGSGSGASSAGVSLPGTSSGAGTSVTLPKLP